ncbi:hypothetical protein Poli38472_007031 [Pythium oligandrum]|uniref:Uncharacterized protein n=1 Tax=Pythium oligandrum TaxID=41045 RepID=A0A8K1C9J6_PYTOL|nr:hypothetical protein Poli38472_007031 [Pythium oligandrum]|eukprot:TMW58886.1 hypothetical protein Poli38472_007031 [Pythium oligandrum]
MTNDCEVHRANAAVHHAVRTAFAPPPFVPSSPQKLNPTAIRGSPIQPLTTGPRGTLMRGPPLPMAPPTQIPGVVSEGSPEKQKLEALREKVLARRPPTLQTLAPSSPPRRPAEESGAPAIDTSDMSPTRRKMLLRGPNAMMLAPIAPPVLSPREDEVLAAAAGVDQTTVEAMTLDSEEDVQAISRLVFEVQQEQEETKPRRPRGRE